MKTLEISDEQLDEWFVNKLKEDYLFILEETKKFDDRSKENPLDVVNLKDLEYNTELLEAMGKVLYYNMSHSEYRDWLNSLEK